MVRLFISYGIGDDDAFVQRLYADLKVANFDVWWDKRSMESRGLTLLQEIQDAIARMHRLILVVGPRALRSDYVRVEWRCALRHCTVVNVVLRQGELDELPEELRLHHAADFRRDDNYAVTLARFVEQLKSEVAPLGRLVGVPALTDQYIERSTEILHLSALALAEIQSLSSVAAPVACLRGMGGAGKSVLAAAFARRCETRRAFPDGIYWVRVGQAASREDLLAEAGLALNSAASPASATGSYLKHLTDSLAPLRCLFIADDVWAVNQVDSLHTAMGPRCRLLITTRDSEIARAIAGENQIELGMLNDHEARRLLDNWSGLALEALPTEAVLVIEKCGRLPLALALCGAMVAGKRPWGDVLHHLGSANLAHIQGRLPQYEDYRSLFDALHASMEFLESQRPGATARYAELAVFQQGEPVPETAIYTLWRYAAGCDEVSARDWLSTFDSRALLALSGTAGARRVMLHDLLHDYARARANDALPGLHRGLLDGYQREFGREWSEIPDDGYLQNHLVYHLLQGERQNELYALLDRRNSSGSSVWFEARSALDPSGGRYLHDVQLAVHHAEALDAKQLQVEQPPPLLAREIRSALAISTLASLSVKIDPELLALLVQKGLWLPTQALAAAWQMPTLGTTASALEKLAPHLDADQAGRALRWFLHDQHSQFSSFFVTAQFKRLVQLDEVDRAITLAREAPEKDRGQCQECLASLCLEEGRADAALLATEAIQDGGRTPLLCERLARVLPFEYVGRLKTLVARLGDGWRKDTASAALAVRCIELNQVSDALDVLREIKDLPQRAKVLAALGPRTPGALAAECLSDAERLAERNLSDSIRTLEPVVPLLVSKGHGDRLLLIADRCWTSRTSWTQTWIHAAYVFSLTNHLTGPHRLKLLDRLGTILKAEPDPKARAGFLDRLAESLAEPEKSAFLQSASEAVEAIPKIRQRIECRIKRLNRFAVSERSLALETSFQEAMSIPGETDRSGALIFSLVEECAKQGEVAGALEIIRKLPSDAGSTVMLASQRLIIVAPIGALSAEHLTAIRAKLDRLKKAPEHQRALGSLARRFAAIGREKEAMSLVEELSDPEAAKQAAKEVAPYLSLPRARRVLRKLLRDSRAIGDGGRIRGAVGAIAAALEANGAFTDALDLTDTSSDLRDRTWGLLELADRLPADFRPAAVEKLRLVEPAVAASGDHFALLSIWIKLGLHSRVVQFALEHPSDPDVGLPYAALELARVGARSEAEAVAVAIADPPTRARAVAYLAGVLPTPPSLLLEALDWARRQSGYARDQFSIWMFFASLTRELSGESLEFAARGRQALQAELKRPSDARAVRDHISFLGLRIRLPQDLIQQWFEALLEFLPEPPEKVDGEPVDRALEWLTEQLDSVTVTQFADRLVSEVRNAGPDLSEGPFGFAQLLRAIGARLPEPQRTELVENLFDRISETQERKLKMLTMLYACPLLPPLERKDWSAPSAAFVLEALATQDDIKIHEELFRLALPAVLELEPMQLHQWFIDASHLESKLQREDFVRFLVAILPVINRLGGNAALLETAQALRDTAVMWP